MYWTLKRLSPSTGTILFSSAVNENETSEYLYFYYHIAVLNKKPPVILMKLPKDLIFYNPTNGKKNEPSLSEYDNDLKDRLRKVHDFCIH